MFTGYYYVDQHTEMCPAKYKYKRRKLVDIPYEFYEPDARLLLDFTELEKGCAFTWHTILDLKNIVTKKLTSEKREIFDNLFESQAPRYAKTLYGVYIISDKLDNIVHDITHCKYFEFRFADIEGYMIDSFMPLYISDEYTITALAVGYGAFNTERHKNNVLEIVTLSGDINTYEVKASVVVKTPIALNKNI